MFGTPKPAFGQPTSAFGFSTPTNASLPFGSTSAFGKPAATGGAPGAFGAGTAFGAPGAAAAPSGLFGNPTAVSQTGGLFGSPAPAAQAGFGAFGQPSTSGLFGGNASSTLFGQPTVSQSAFGAKPAGFGGFGSPSTAANTGLFGANQATPSLFGQPTAAAPTGGLFGNTSVTGFGAAQPTSGTVIKYNPVSGTDVMLKNGQSQNISIKHHCITCMKEYESKSLEELRLEDYMAGRRGPQQAAAGGLFGATNTFGSPTANTGFGAENKSATGLFGQTTGFGQQSAATAGGLFGKPATSGFGTTPGAFSFGAGGAGTGSSLFGSAAKPGSGAAAPGLFGTSAAPAFAQPTQQPSFGFPTNPQQQSAGLFGNKPAGTGFEMPQTSNAAGFGGFGANTLGQQQAGGLFGAKQPNANPFGIGTMGGFGNTATNAFGAPTSTPSLFGGANAFGAKPVMSTPGFTGFGTQQAVTSGLGVGLPGLGTNPPSLFGPKPGGLGTGQTGATLGAPTFNTGSSALGTGVGGMGGLGSFGTGTLGQTNAPLFGNTSFGGFGTNTSGALNTGLGYGNMANINTSFGLNNSAGVNVHEQILSLAAKPFGDSPLLKDLVPSIALSANELKPTNPAAQMALLDNSTYRVSSSIGTSAGIIRALPQPRALSNSVAKKSLFDGLEENDSTLEEKLTMRHSAKRLVLRPKPVHAVGSVNYPIDSPSVADGLRKDGDRSLNQSADGNQSYIAEPQNRSTDSPDSFGFLPNSGNIQRRATLSSGSSSPALKGINTGESSGRRASWLTTKPLVGRGGAISPLEGGAALEDTIAQLCPPRENQSSSPQTGLYPSLSQFNRSGLLDIEDKENIDSATAAEGSVGTQQPYEPHPTGIKLTRPGYYTIPSLDDLIGYIRADGACVVPQFTIGRHGYGHVFYNCEMDVAGLDLDEIVHFLNKEVVVYPDDSKRPPVGQALNRKAQVTLDRVWPRDKTARHHITDAERLANMDYEGKLRNVCDKHNTKFIEYRPQTGSWVFKVDHFSKYGLSDSDEEDELPVARVGAPLQKPAQTLPAQNIQTGLRQAMKGHSVLQGLGGLLDDQEMAMDSQMDTRSHRLYTQYKGSAMDTSEENSTESTTLYPDVNRSLAAADFSHKGSFLMSPTSELARFDRRSSHAVQLMKASLYNRRSSDVSDVSLMVEDDGYVVKGAGDQMVPQPVTPRIPVTSQPSKMAFIEPGQPDAPSTLRETTAKKSVHEEMVALTPPAVQPKVVILKRRRHFVPFNRSIAAKVDASCPSEEALSQGRKFRIGMGAAGRIALHSSVQWATNLSKDTTLSTLASLADGRDSTDESVPVVLNLRIAGGGPDPDQHFRESIEPHLEVCLQHSELVLPSEDLNVSVAVRGKNRTNCPRFTVTHVSSSVAALLKEHSRIAAKLCERDKEKQIVSDQKCLTSQYCKEVWSLCQALWGLHLEPTEEGLQNPLLEERNRHEALSQWLAKTVAPTVDAELKRGGLRIDEDKDEVHCASILTLLTGRRLLEACRLATKHNDHILALILSQIGGDVNFRSLVAHQLRSWCECSATELIGRSRGAALLLATGAIHWPQFQPRYAHMLDWLRAFAIHFWYVCPTYCHITEAVAAYEKSLLSDVNGNTEFAEGNDAENITMLTNEDCEGLDQQSTKEHYAFPAPPYGDNFHVEIRNGEQRRKRVLDLRYVLLQIAADRSSGTTGNASLPESYTMDPLDYRLSWLVQMFLWSAGVSHAPPSVRITLDFATQLETRGMWHWAAYILLFIDEEATRTRLIRDLLSRCVGSGDILDTSKHQLAFVRDRLKVPETWLRIAQAQRAKYENKPILEAEHLVAAGEWNAAHCLILEIIVPNAVLADNVKSVEPLLIQLAAAADRNQVFDWDSGGSAIHNYIKLYDELSEVVCGEKATSDELRVRLRKASVWAVALPADAKAGLKAMAARCELGSKLALLAYRVLAISSNSRSDMSDQHQPFIEDLPLTSSAARTLIHLISKLGLPIDYTYEILAKCNEALGDESSDAAADVMLD